MAQALLLIAVILLTVVVTFVGLNVSLGDRQLDAPLEPRSIQVLIGSDCGL